MNSTAKSSLRFLRYLLAISLYTSIGISHADMLSDGKNALAAGQADKAIQVLGSSASSGNPEAQNLMGEAYFAKGDTTRASEWFEKAAKQDHAVAINNLGYLYENGYGVGRNYVRAAQLYREAALKGVPESQYAIGNLYYLGRGVVKDPVQGSLWLRKAAAQGNTKAGELLAKVEREQQMVRTRQQHADMERQREEHEREQSRQAYERRQVEVRSERAREIAEQNRHREEERVARAKVVDNLVKSINQTTSQLQHQNAAVAQQQQLILQQQALRDHERIEQKLESAAAVSGSGRTIGGDPALEAQRIVSTCNSRCASEKNACDSGSQSACYRAAACQCQCFLDEDTTNSPARGQWRQCVADNTAKADQLKGAPTVISPNQTTQLPARRQLPPSGSQYTNCDGTPRSSPRPVGTTCPARD